MTTRDSYFKMEAQGGRFLPNRGRRLAGALAERSERMDVVIGSGVRGQSYLYWHGEQLFELPVSYWSDGGRWINSPGYKNGTMNFARAVTPRCLECHATSIRAAFARTLPAIAMTSRAWCWASPANAATGRARTTWPCIELRATHPPAAEAILNPAKFSRDRQVDLCALCHNGIRSEELAPAFSLCARASRWTATCSQTQARLRRIRMCMATRWGC